MLVIFAACVDHITPLRIVGHAGMTNPARVPRRTLSRFSMPDDHRIPRKGMDSVPGKRGGLNGWMQH